VHLQTQRGSPTGAGAHHSPAVAARATAQELAANLPSTAPDSEAEAAGMLTLRQDGFEKVPQGLTDMAEVVAATNL